MSIDARMPGETIPLNATAADVIFSRSTRIRRIAHLNVQEDKMTGQMKAGIVIILAVWAGLVIINVIAYVIIYGF